MGAELQPGDRARVKAAMYRPTRTPEDNTFIMRGQIMELTEEDLARSDAHLIWEPVDQETLDVLDDPDAEKDLGDDEVAVDYQQPDSEALFAALKKLNLKRAKLFLSDPNWSVEALQDAKDAEERGKNREPILQYIDGRIEQLDVQEGEQV